jgi:hypothetical protein
MFDEPALSVDIKGKAKSIQELRFRRGSGSSPAFRTKEHMEPLHQGPERGPSFHLLNSEPSTELPSLKTMALPLSRPLSFKGKDRILDKGV